MKTKNYKEMFRIFLKSKVLMFLSLTTIGGGLYELFAEKHFEGALLCCGVVITGLGLVISSLNYTLNQK